MTIGSNQYVFFMTSLFQVRLQVASLPDAVKIRKSFEVSGDVTL